NSFKAGSEAIGHSNVTDRSGSAKKSKQDTAARRVPRGSRTPLLEDTSMMNARTTTFPVGLQIPVEGLRVIGEAVREAPPEVVELGFEIHGMGLTAAFALQDCVVRTIQMGQALTGIGIPQTDLQAGPMGVRSTPFAPALNPHTPMRSEERRVGKECRDPRGPYQQKQKTERKQDYRR